MSKWLGYMVELYHDGQWFNIDQWHRHANGQLRHHFLYAAPERDILSSAHDELALSKVLWPHAGRSRGAVLRILCRPKDTGSCDYTSQKVERGTGSSREE